MPAPVGFGSRAVPDCQERTEAFPEDGLYLRAERYFRYEHEGVFAAPQDRFYQADVEFSLAASGNAIEDKRFECGIFQMWGYGIEGKLLVVGQLEHAPGGSFQTGRLSGHLFPVFERDSPPGSETS